MNKYDLDNIINWCFTKNNDLKIYDYKYHSHQENYNPKHNSLLITFYSEVFIDEYISFEFLKIKSKKLQVGENTFILSNVLTEIRLNKLNKLLNDI